MRQLGPLPVLGLWAAFCFGGGLYASWFGYGGRSLAAMLTAFAFFLAVAWLMAARGVADSVASRSGPGGGLILGTSLFLAYLVYAIGTNSLNLARGGTAAAIVFLPLALAVSAEGKPPGAWQDFITLCSLWIFVKFSPSHWLWPYPDGRLAYVFTVLIALNTALASYVLVRRLTGTGYSIGWGRHWSFYIVVSFVVFACIAIPLGQGIHFIAFSPRRTGWGTFPSLSMGIFIFTAWPEEFLFRGLLQNILSRAWKSDLAGWLTASIIFGFSHLTNGVFPNWRYVLLASIAGLFYGWTWRKSGSIFASALVHAAVDITWRFLFRTI